MDAPPEPLTPKEHQLLLAIIQREAPELMPVVRDAVNARWLVDDEVEALNGVLLNVFLRTLDKDDEPTREGVEADNLLGRIEMQRRGFWNR